MFWECLNFLQKGEPVELGLEPEDLRGLPDDSLGPVVTDATDDGLTYGDILVDVLDSYQTVRIPCAYAITAIYIIYYYLSLSIYLRVF